jgi:hypothetical protein
MISSSIAHGSRLISAVIGRPFRRSSTGASVNAAHLGRSKSFGDLAQSTPTRIATSIIGAGRPRPTTGANTTWPVGEGGVSVYRPSERRTMTAMIPG